MKLLLDTHALIWFAENHASLSSGAAQALTDEQNDLFCSVVSIWEMAIKISLRKLKVASRLDSAFHRRLENSGFSILPVDYAHAAHVATLPWHHRDPFDRLLTAQAILEQMALVSHDNQLDAYGIQRIW
jgi:PIN domain nuclease of toxin-antitoxin system